MTNKLATKENELGTIQLAPQLKSALAAINRVPGAKQGLKNLKRDIDERLLLTCIHNCYCSSEDERKRAFGFARRFGASLPKMAIRWQKVADEVERMLPVLEQFGKLYGFDRLPEGLRHYALWLRSIDAGTEHLRDYKTGTHPILVYLVYRVSASRKADRVDEEHRRLRYKDLAQLISAVKGKKSLSIPQERENLRSTVNRFLNYHPDLATQLRLEAEEDAVEWRRKR